MSETQKPFDINRPYRTRDGGDAWALRLPEPIKGKYIYVGAYRHSDGQIYQASWAADGRWNPITEYSYDGADLINIPERRTVKVWINVYPNVEDWDLSLDRRRADVRAANVGYPGSPDCIACIEREITFEVGEGLS